MERVRSGAGDCRRAAGGLGARRPRPRIGIPLRGKAGQAVAAVPQAPADRRRRAVGAIPVVPAGSAGEGERQHKRNRPVARPQVADVPTPWIRTPPGPAVWVDRVPGSEQVAHLEVDVRPGRVAGAAAERNQLTPRHMLTGVDEELIVVKVGGAVEGVIDHHAPAAAIAPFAVDHRSLIGRDHRRIRGHRIVDPAVTVVRVAGGPVETNHHPVRLPVRVVVVHP